MKLRLSICTVLSLLLCQSLFAQQRGIDSLLGLLKDGDDSLKCIYLAAYVESETDIDIWPAYNKLYMDIADKRIRSSKSAAEKTFYLEAYSNAIINQGFYLQQKGKLKESVKEFHKALDIKFDINDRAGAANALLNIGYMYASVGNYKKASYYYNKCLTVQEEVDKSGAATTIINLANICVAQGDTAKYIELVNRALDYRVALKEERGIANCYNALAVVDIHRKDFKKAKERTNAALKIFEAIGYRHGIGYTYDLMGSIHFRTGEINIALDCFNRSLTTHKEIGDARSSSDISNHLGQYYDSLRQNAKAKRYFVEALKYAQDCGELRQLRNAYQSLSKFYNRIGNRFEADRTQKFYLKYHDSLNRATQFDLELPDFAEIPEMQQDTSDRTEIAERKISDEEDIPLVYYAAGLFLLGAVVFFLVKRKKGST